jgi:hypothetical protein
MIQEWNTAAAEQDNTYTLLMFRGRLSPLLRLSAAYSGFSMSGFRTLAP